MTPWAAPTKRLRYEAVFQRLLALCAGETDVIALMATIACELRQNFDYFHWVGFYRNIGGELLKIGPYQGGHGCLTIPFDRGVCGRCARERAIQNVPDVDAIAYHIACASSTKSEIVIPITNRWGQLLAVLDIDSDGAAAFDEVDEEGLMQMNAFFVEIAPG